MSGKAAPLKIEKKRIIGYDGWGPLGLALLIGTIGGFVFNWLRMPLAWMLGACVFSTAAAFFGLQLLLGRPALGTEDSALYRAMTLLVVLSPCALVLSVPSAVLAAIANGARHGILFRGGAAVERLADVDCVCFDKTGTLTAGEPAVAALEVFPANADRRWKNR